MAQDAASKPDAHMGKLTRQELEEILKINVQLYKNEEQFHNYITELIIYLMRYEFDWSEFDDIPLIDKERMVAPLPEPRRLASKKQQVVCPYCRTNLFEESMFCPFCQGRLR